MQRNKTIAYDDDDIYDEDDYYDDPEQEDQPYEYTEEDKHNFSTLTPVVRAEIEEAGLQASDREIEDALWDSYWDVGESVRFLKGVKGGKGKGSGEKGKEGKKEKGGSRFDMAAERSKGVNVGKGELGYFLDCCGKDGEGIGGQDCVYSGSIGLESRRGGLYTTSPINLEDELTRR